MKNKIQFIETDEYIQSELCLRETYVCKTQKRLYVSKNSKKRKTQKVINLNTVQSVSLEEGREKRSSGPLLMGLIFAGASAFFAFKENLKPVFLSLLFIGIALTLIGIVVKIPRYYSKLIVSSYGYPIELNFEKVTGNKEEALKKLLFSVLTQVEQAEKTTDVTYDTTGDENLTQIPVVEPVQEAVQETVQEPETQEV